jgi:RimJ/RimL family protein N-acetyltransferase
MDFNDFTISPITIKDVQHYYLFVNDNRARIAEYFPLTNSSTTDCKKTRKFVKEKIKMRKAKAFYSFLIKDKSRVIGTIFLKNIDWKVLKSECGYFIDHEYEGKGITSKALKFITDFAFNEVGLNKLYLRIAEENIASKRVAEKNNFQLEGKLREDFKTSSGNYIDVLYFGLLKS